MTNKYDTMVVELGIGEDLIEMHPVRGEQRLEFVKENDTFFLVFKEGTPTEKIEQVYDILRYHLMHLQFLKHD